jgi:hypothetical protein
MRYAVAFFEKRKDILTAWHIFAAASLCLLCFGGG